MLIKCCCTIWFDSCEDESIDELAKVMGVASLVAEVTNRAMGGDMEFKQALELRLNAMKPSQADLQGFLEVHPPRISKVTVI